MKTAFVFLTLLIISVLSFDFNAEKLSKQKEDIEALKTTVGNLAALVNKTCPCQPPLTTEAPPTTEAPLTTEAPPTTEAPLTTTPLPTPQASSCQELYEKDPSIRNGTYTLLVNSENIVVYCHMGINGCGDGGWTPAMKIDGKKSTFHYDSDYWGNNGSYNDAGGETGFDEIETKLPTYWNTSFSKICLGMKVNEQHRFTVINKPAISLYSLIADGQYRATSLSRDTWKSLVGEQASLQLNCNQQGFNAKSEINPGTARARIGILGNNEYDCVTSDSRIGFGTGGSHDDSNTCGNETKHGGDNGDKHIKAMGYILVQ